MNRRHFSQSLPIFALASYIAPGSLDLKKKLKMGLQLYTLRDQLKEDLLGTLKEVSRIGYEVVEVFGYDDRKYFGQTTEDFKKILSDHNLTAPSGHYLWGKHMPDLKGTILNGWEYAIEDALKLGHKYMVFAYLFPEERKSLDDYKQLSEDLIKAAELCKKAGMQFCYHNHDFEFEKLDGEIPFDMMMKELDPDLVKFELDLYWIAKAGFDPITYFDKAKGRYPLWHVKDMTNTPEKEFTEVGNGVIDFVKIFKTKKIAGLDYFFVEQDICKNHTPLESVEISYYNLKKMKIA